ncbi:sugar transferase [Leifsonia sp. AG29]|uniref:sugar transferase n=1 Tax=Leifsonia sp. AG29 TaxID=2598860 RepID=UPI00131B99E2|nr:sugar transferase [Leifsonia sp. AG29]
MTDDRRDDGHGGTAIGRSGSFPLARPHAALALTDALIVIAALLASTFVAGAAQLLSITGAIAAAVLAAGWVIALRVGNTRDERILGSGTAEFRRVLVSSLSFAGSALLLFAIFGADLATGHVVIALPLGVVLLVLSRAVWRLVLRRLRRRGAGLLPVLVAGENAARVSGHLTADPAASGLRPIAVLPGALDHAEVVRRAVAAHAGAVVLAGDIGDPRDAQHLMWSLQDRGIDVIVSTDLPDVAPSRLAYRVADGLPLAHLRGRRTHSVGRVVKGAIDRVGAAVGLVLLAPVFAAVALLIRLDDRGPVFFRQERVGRDGRRFRMLKFRTMCVDAEKRLEELRDANDSSGPLFKIRHDPRITRVGRTLRKYSIDELPQLWNVLVGDMSLIGPRPALPSEVASYPDHATRRLLVQPGMTGLWQVSGRADLSWEAGLRLDLSYVDNWFLHRDVAILARTAGVLVRPRGAY